MSDALFELEPAGPVGFQMQSWSSSDQRWKPMEEIVKTIWKPRSTPWDAVYKCAQWTGLIFMPAMRVVDLRSGTVIWSETSRYPEAGASVVPEWASAVYERVHDDFRAEREAEVPL